MPVSESRLLFSIGTHFKDIQENHRASGTTYSPSYKVVVQSSWQISHTLLANKAFLGYFFPHLFCDSDRRLLLFSGWQKTWA